MIPAAYSSYNPQFSRNLTIQKLIERHQLEKILEDWEIHATGNFEQAKNIILEFHNNETTIESANQPKKLNLSSCKLDCLPNIFIYPPFLDLVEIDVSDNLLTDLPNMDKLINLRELKLSGNKFKIFPTTIFSLEKLENLSLNSNELKQCPDLGVLQNLAILKLSDNFLSEVPKGIHQLSKLRILRLANNRISKFPSNLYFPSALEKLSLTDLDMDIVPDWISLSTSLTSLNISDNNLTSLPSFIGNLLTLKVLKLRDNDCNIFPKSLTKLENLEDIHLSRNGLNEFPEILLNLSGLKKIHLDANQLTSIPDLHPLKNLESINLQYNQLRTLPEHLNLLSEEVEIDVEENEFTAEEVERIQSMIQRADYEGPDIVGLSIGEDDTEDLPGETLGDFYNVLYQFAGIPPKNLSNLPNDSLELESWLRRLGHVSEFRTDSNKKAIATTILSFLEKADQDPSFRDVFLNVIAESSRTCGDRMALSILKLDIYNQLEKADLTNTNQLYKLLLRGVYAIDLLEECARKKIEEQKASDDIETYLAYPIKLKEDLNLPFTQTTMRYFECSQVTDSDLTSAKNIVLEKLSNNKDCISFVVKQEKWKKSLSLICPKEWKKIENKKQAALDEEIPDYESIQNTFYKDLEHLTGKVLSNSIDLREQFLDNPLESISNCLEKSKFNVKQATSELVIQRDNILSKIFTSATSFENNLFRIETLLTTLYFLYEQTCQEELLLFLLPSSEKPHNVLSISSCVKDILRRNSGRLYSYLLCKLIEKETISKEVIEKLSITENNPLNKFAKKMSLLTRLTTLTNSASNKTQEENIDSNLINNLIPILICMEKFVFSKEKYGCSEKKRFKGASTENLRDLSSSFDKLKATVNLNTYKINIKTEKIQYTREQLLDLLTSYRNLEETQIKLNNLVTDNNLLPAQASTSHYSKQPFEEKTLLAEQELLTKQLQQLLIQKKNLQQSKLDACSILFGTFLSAISRPVPRNISPINISCNQSVIRDNSSPLIRSSIHIQPITSSERPSTSGLDTRLLDLPTVPDNQLERSERTITTRIAMMDPIYYKKV